MPSWLDRIVTWVFRRLARIGLAEPSIVQTSSTAASVIDAAKAGAGGSGRAGSRELLIALLAAESSGFVRLVRAVGVSVDDLGRDVRSSTASSSDASVDEIVGRSFDVVPAEAVEVTSAEVGAIRRRQTLHTSHLLWGMLRARRSDAGDLLRRYGFDGDGLRAESDVWGVWNDPD